MKSFTQRWREASDEAEDQPMEDTPTDPKEAPVIAHTDYKAIASGLQRVNAALESALAAQTERADRLQAEVAADKRVFDTLREFARRMGYFANSIPEDDRDLVGRVIWKTEQLAEDHARLTAELDAVRKANAELQIELQHCPTCAKTKAKCAELEKLIQDASAWRPIETAPKTGDDFKAIEILGWIPDYADVIDGGDRDVIYWEPRKEQWFCRGHAVPNPTHWQPLPAPPEEKRP